MDIFEKISKLDINEEQTESLEEFITHSDDYEKMFMKISEFIRKLEPDIDRDKIEQKSEDLLRIYPPTLISELNETEKWLLFNRLALFYLTKAIDTVSPPLN